MFWDGTYCGMTNWRCRGSLNFSLIFGTKCPQCSMISHAIMPWYMYIHVVWKVAIQVCSLYFIWGSVYLDNTAGLRESHAVILRDRVVPASQVPFPGEPSGEPGNGTWRAGTTLYRRNDSVGFFFSPVTIELLQRIRTKTSFDQFCIRFIQIYRLLWSSARVRNELLTNHRRDIKTQGEGRWTRQG